MVFISEFMCRISKVLLCVFVTVIATSSISCVGVDLVEKPKTKLTVDLPSLVIDSLKSGSYTVDIGGRTIVLDENNSDLPVLSAGVYPVLIYSNTNTIQVVGGIATVGLVNGQLNSSPNWFFSVFQNLTIANSLFETPNITIQQQVRLLRLVLNPPTGGIYDRVTSITAKLTGVAGHWDLINNIPLGPIMEVPVSFIKQDDGTWLADIRLIGIFGNQQELIGEIQYAGTSQQQRIVGSILKANLPYTVDLQSDLSATLKNFNTGKEVPLDINGAIQMPIEAGFSATIKEWIPISETGTAW